MKRINQLCLVSLMVLFCCFSFFTKIDVKASNSFEFTSSEETVELDWKSKNINLYMTSGSSEVSEWNISDTNVAEIDYKSSNYCRLKVNNTGKVTVTATSITGETAMCTVIAVGKEIQLKQNVKSFEVDNDDYYGYIYADYSNSAYIKDWTCSNESVVEIISTSDVGCDYKIVGAGTAIITAKGYYGQTANYTVNVSAKPIVLKTKSLNLIAEPLDYSKYKNDYYEEYDYEEWDSIGSIVLENNSGKVVKWKSSNPSVASVSNGSVEAKSTGSATITLVGKWGQTATCTVNVTKAKTNDIVLDDNLLFLDYTKELQSLDVADYSVKVKSWKSSNSCIKIYSGDDTGCLFEIKKPGTAIITATGYHGQTDTCKIIVENNINLKEDSITIQEGESSKIRLYEIYKRGKVKYSSSNKKIVTVSSTGKIVGKKKGKATITVKVKGKKLKCKVTVKKAKLKFFSEFTYYNTRDNIIWIRVHNHSFKPVTIISSGAKLIDWDYKKYDRSLKLTGNKKSITIKGNKKKYVGFKVIGTNTWPGEDRKDIKFKIKFNGKTYTRTATYDDSCSYCEE